MLAYRAILEPGENPGVFVVTFPDVPEAITDGDGEANALENAVEALSLALSTYRERGMLLPTSTDGPGVWVTADADVVGVPF